MNHLCFIWFVLLFTLSDVVSGQFTNSEISRILKQAELNNFDTNQMLSIRQQIDNNLKLKDKLNDLQKQKLNGNGNGNVDVETQIRVIKEELISNVQRLLRETNPNNVIMSKGYTERAIERGRKRVAEMKQMEEKRKLEEAQIHFIENERKMELLFLSLQEYRSRALSHGMDVENLRKLNGLLYDFQTLQASYIYNHTNFENAQEKRNQIEKFMGDYIDNTMASMQRRIEIIDDIIHDLLNKAILNNLCEYEMKELQSMIGKYRDAALRRLYDHRDVSGSHKESQMERIKIEKYIGSKKKESKMECMVSSSAM